MGRSPCCVVDHVNKGAWTAEEDRLLVAYIQAHGEGNWKSLPDAAGLRRCGKSCRLRWKNYLRPDLKRGGFTTEEENVIIKLQGLFGNRWSRIAASLPGRTDNEIKNHWNTHIKRKLLKRGDVIFKTVTSCRSYKTSRLDLDLTISPPSSFSPPSSSSSLSSASSSTTDLTAGSTQQWTAEARERAVSLPLCFCYDLGFKGSDECYCQGVVDRSRSPLHAF